MLNWGVNQYIHSGVYMIYIWWFITMEIFNAFYCILISSSCSLNLKHFFPLVEQMSGISIVPLGFLKWLSILKNNEFHFDISIMFDHIIILLSFSPSILFYTTSTQLPLLLSYPSFPHKFHTWEKQVTLFIGRLTHFG